MFDAPSCHWKETKLQNFTKISSKCSGLFFSLIAPENDHQQINKTYFHANETTRASFAAGVQSTWLVLPFANHPKHFQG